MKDIQSTKTSRRAFVSSLALGATAGMAAISHPVQASIRSELFGAHYLRKDSGTVDEALKSAGQKSFPVAFDGSQANPWPIIWSNVYYLTNEMSGISNADLGVIGVLRHSGILFTFKDDLIKEYQLGEVFGYNDPFTNQPATRNTLWEPKEGTMPAGLTGVKGLMDKGELFCACDMAYKHYSGMIAEKRGMKPEDVYNDFVSHKHDGIHLAPSGVWVLGRMSTYGVSYIDASVG